MSTVSQVIVLETTYDTKDMAHAMAKTAIEKRLAACAHVQFLEGSVYIWNHELQDTQEYKVSFKTTHAKSAALENFLSTEHPYDVPMILKHSTCESSKAYAEFVQSAVD